MKSPFIADFRASGSSFKNVLITSSKAFSAFTLICAFPARKPEDSSVFGNSCLLKFPSLI